MCHLLREGRWLEGLGIRKLHHEAIETSLTRVVLWKCTVAP